MSKIHLQGPGVDTAFTAALAGPEPTAGPLIWAGTYARARRTT
ncbi:MAG: hypothetical protein QGF12_06195 [SAR202 cluster bacterium]|nr:hypothetical protein [SAR202 cluster bacterium]